MPPRNVRGQPDQTRFMVRRSTREVFIWTEALAKRNDLEEVWALNAEQALERDTMPDPKSMSLDQLEAMSKEELVIFAEIKLNLKVDPELKKSQMLEKVKIAIFSLPSLDDEDEVVGVDIKPAADVQPARTKTAPMPSAAAARGRAGM